MIQSCLIKQTPNVRDELSAGQTGMLRDSVRSFVRHPTKRRIRTSSIMPVRTEKLLLCRLASNSFDLI
jgi:hypothetical protein